MLKHCKCKRNICATYNCINIILKYTFETQYTVHKLMYKALSSLPKLCTFYWLHVTLSSCGSAHGSISPSSYLRHVECRWVRLWKMKSPNHLPQDEMWIVEISTEQIKNSKRVVSAVLVEIIHQYCFPRERKVAFKCPLPQPFWPVADEKVTRKDDELGAVYKWTSIYKLSGLWLAAVQFSC